MGLNKAPLTTGESNIGWSIVFRLMVVLIPLGVVQTATLTYWMGGIDADVAALIEAQKETVKVSKATSKKLDDHLVEDNHRGQALINQARDRIEDERSEVLMRYNRLVDRMERFIRRAHPEMEGP